VARVLLGKTVDDSVSVESPEGISSLLILEVEYE